MDHTRSTKDAPILKKNIKRLHAFYTFISTFYDRSNAVIINPCLKGL